jgi:hypothetical protein
VLSLKQSQAVGELADYQVVAMYEHRKLEKEPLDSDLELLDRWAMDALIPREKELMLLMRYEGRLTRHLRLDMLQLEHMQRQRRDDRREKRPLLTLAEPEPTAPPLPPAEPPESLGEHRALRSGTEPESQSPAGYAERDPDRPAFALAQPESLGASTALHNPN